MKYRQNDKLWHPQWGKVVVLRPRNSTQEHPAEPLGARPSHAERMYDVQDEELGREFMAVESQLSRRFS